MLRKLLNISKRDSRHLLRQRVLLSYYYSRRETNHDSLMLLCTSLLMGTAVCLYSTTTSSQCQDLGNTVSENIIANTDNKGYKTQPLSNIQKLKTALLATKIIRLDQIDDDEEECILRGKPWNSYHVSNIHPGIIVYPESTEEVSEIVKLCNGYHVPIVAFGGGTSLEGQTLTLNEGSISLDFSRMKSVVALNTEDLDAIVQAGLGYVELNEILKSYGLWFPLDPGPGASIGGMCACRCSGSTAVRYGSMRENVLSLTAVLSDGTIIKSGSRARKSSAGYDITRLLVGSEGTLAIITEATLKLHGIPKYSFALRISFPNSTSNGDKRTVDGVVIEPGVSGLHAAAMTAKDTLNCGVTIGRCELLDEEMVRIINAANNASDGDNQAPGVSAKWPENVTLLYEVTGISYTAAEEQAAIVRGIAESNGGKNIHVAKSKEETANIWKQRKECLWAAMSQFPDKVPMITDVCVPLTKLPLLVAETKKRIQHSALPCPIIAHAGDGNFHVLIFFSRDDPQESTEAKNLANWMAKKAISLGGTCTGEHGVGTGKKELLQSEMGKGSIDLMKNIKKALDPAGLFNPGKVIDP